MLIITTLDAKTVLRRSRTKKAAKTFALRKARKSGRPVEVWWTDTPKDPESWYLQVTVYPDGDIVEQP
jgi:hypothetical protein